MQGCQVGKAGGTLGSVQVKYPKRFLAMPNALGVLAIRRSGELARPMVRPTRHVSDYI